MLTKFLFKLLKRIKDGQNLKFHLQQASKCDRYLITVTYQLDKNTETLEHFWVVNKFPTQAIPPALSFIYKKMVNTNTNFYDLLHGDREKI